MQRQVADLRQEGDDLYELLSGLREEDWRRPTPFKQWTVNEVVAHLHSGDWLAVQSLKHPERFAELRAARDAARRRGEEPAGGGIGPEPLAGQVLLDQWRTFFLDMCDLLQGCDPAARLQWTGPDMSARSFASARQMETWAHGHDIYDLLRRPRTYTDRIRNIAVLGCRTFGWTFRNRGLEPPEPIPYVRLTAPSGAIWEWHEPSDEHRVEGSAVEFCHVVTQGRNIADVNLRVAGESATRWMSIAQCFAGPPRDPPAPGERAWERQDSVGERSWHEADSVPRIHLTYSLDPDTDSRYTIFIYDIELQEIAAAVEADPDAMAALKEGWELSKAAIRRGDISSPPPPSSYSKLYEIVGRCDPRFKGTLSTKIIRYLERTHLEGKGH